MWCRFIALLAHFECDTHIGHMLTGHNLPPPLTSTVKSSLFMHAYSSPLSLAARLHGCCTRCSGYVSNGWTFSRETSYMRLLNVCKSHDFCHMCALSFVPTWHNTRLGSSWLRPCNGLVLILSVTAAVEYVIAMAPVINPHSSAPTMTQRN